MDNLSYWGLANMDFLLYIVDDDLIVHAKFRHMKKMTHSTHLGEATTTILLAAGFLGLVMLLSYLFITGMG